MKRAKALMGVGIALLCVPWAAFVTTKLWDWFAVPLHAPALSLWHAAGLTVLARFVVVPRRLLKDNDDNEEVWKSIFLGFANPAIFLGIGALYRWWAS